MLSGYRAIVRKTLCHSKDSGVAGQGVVASDYPMAWREDGGGICSVSLWRTLRKVKIILFRSSLRRNLRLNL